jgi:two-component system, response regulator YesN
MGYKNIVYFNRQFKLSTGMTPGEYRKKHKI